MFAICLNQTLLYDQVESFSYIASIASIPVCLAFTFIGIASVSFVLFICISLIKLPCLIKRLYSFVNLCILSSGGRSRPFWLSINCPVPTTLRLSLLGTSIVC